MGKQFSIKTLQTSNNLPMSFLEQQGGKP